MDARAEKSFMGPSFYSLDLALRAKVVKSTATNHWIQRFRQAKNLSMAINGLE